jgi:hypothetical protein
MIGFLPHQIDQIPEESTFPSAVAKQESQIAGHKHLDGHRPLAILRLLIVIREGQDF